MPKVARARKFRASTTTTASAPVVTNDTPEESPNQTVPAKASLRNDSQSSDPKQSAVLSRGQRKRQAKREKYLQREKLVLSSLKLKAQEEQAKRIDGLDAIKDALLETVRKQAIATAGEEKKSPPLPPSLLKTNHGRKKLVDQEVTQMNLVLQHPAFQADPLATIREHLQNSFEAAPSHTGPDTEQKQPEKVKRKRRKTKYRAQRSKRR